MSVLDKGILKPKHNYSSEHFHKCINLYDYLGFFISWEVHFNWMFIFIDPQVFRWNMLYVYMYDVLCTSMFLFFIIWSKKFILACKIVYRADINLCFLWILKCINIHIHTVCFWDTLTIAQHIRSYSCCAMYAPQLESYSWAILR